MKVRLLLLLAVVTLAHIPVLGGEFVYDDLTIVKENDRIRSFASIPEIFTKKYWPEEIKAGLYRPLTLTTFVIDYRIWGLRPWGYRLVNLLIHLGNVALLYLLVRRIGFASPAAYLAALVFGIHPVHAETVTSVVGRADLLATLFSLTAFLTFLRYRRRGGAGLVSGFAAAFALGLLSKEAALSLLFILFAWDFLGSPEKVRLPITLRWIAPYAVICIILAIYLPARFSIIGAFGPVDRNTVFFGDPLIDRWGTMLGVLFDYVRMFLFPVELSADFPYYPGRVPGLDLRAALGAVTLLGLLWIAFRRRGALGTAAAIFLLGLAPVSNVIIATGVVKAVRLLYLPSVGLAALAGWCLFRAWGRPGLRPLAVLSLVLLCGLNVVTIGYWLENETLWRRTLRSHPDSVKGLYNLGAILATRGEEAEAEALWLRARVIDERDTGLPVALGRLYLKQDHLGEAGICFEAALELGPPESRAVDALLGRAEVLMRTGNFEAAEKQVEVALQIRPDSAAAYYSLGMTLAEAGDWKGAEEPLRRAVRLDPTLPTPRVQLGLCLYRTGRPAEALREYAEAEGALEGTELADLLVKIGDCLFVLGRREEAISSYREATEIDPASGPAWNNLGGVLFVTGRHREAQVAYRKARSILPGRPLIPLRLGEIALRLGDPEEARRRLTEAIEEAGPSDGAIRDQARAILESME